MAKRPKKRKIYKKKKKQEKNPFYKSKWFFIAIMIFVVIGGVLAAILLPLQKENAKPKEIKPHTYKLNRKYPHDRFAFTQGLLYHDGYLYEGTGLYGQSQIRKVELETGKAVKSHSLEDNLFGEGIEILNGKLYQLTWKAGIVYIYNIENLEPIDSFKIEGDGWGLATDGEKLIISDGSATLKFIDPESKEIFTKKVVTDEKGAVDRLNELEFIDGLIYANVWRTYKIAAIDPSSGKVQFWIDLEGIINPANYRNIDVMNGIAYDKENDRLFVTGKNWPYIYDISIVPPK
ncbi:MAG: glutaminyl-peptide cyclotransferase [Candidatus Zixiibacteriota bacterium]